MLRIVQRNKIYWLRAATNPTTLGPMFICMLICVVILCRSSITYASKNLEIQKAFDNVVKHIKADKKYKDLDVIERKSDKFNIKISQNSGKNLDIYSILKKAKDSFESGDNETATSLLNQIIAKFPYHESALIGLGNIYYANKEIKKAIEIYTKLLKEYSNNPYIFKNFLTIISQYDPDLALSEMLKLYDIHKNYAPLSANLGLTYMKKGDYVKAREYMTEAISLDQNNIFYIYNLAVILDKLSDFKNATAFYLKLLNMSKNASERIPLYKVAARLKFIQLHSAHPAIS
ncbi:tetratricopeptide repeat protein [Wolbachia endosymbiont of Diaphorina citri]|uniref:tetratricopeptide repeat protein n=1 Tax=Wolbachia endosymbiont of Diaphorina citri TaxID=116598 RepID=UPI000477182A|nr:tetratricopeptide repeat protein [Wolbachia endosymbiont of Diaphorina citri]QJT94360.1 tetratricopeptide repeat protein [Wolbachia endosymbiont of Diaphorina citri]QJT95600.1 tetratricopeptide repeat protein [Wolbachia endosymbiont of Diaphorina citri]QJT96962.1 tetratricopeptide repeat protein [Wolbachia endosymbiont of Diaphorina citri]QLK11258.1 tetratricopeptide repeat protein [Wolbachia endosymbiont of Diaphorina citri]QXY87210.1 tetratricopeptide repeat protein [Wolbachia endosymbion